jgi:hypothetical protein
MFLNKEQIKHLQKNGWEIPPAENGTFWFGQDWDDRYTTLEAASGALDLPIDDDNGNEIIGWDFLVVAMRPNVVESDEEE